MASKPKKILCVCIGNSDRSPVMAAVLGMFLKNAGHEVMVESAGTNAKEGCAAEFGVMAAKRLGLDLSGHRKTHVSNVRPADYDLVVCMDDKIALTMVEAGVDMKKIFNGQITNPWPCQFPEQYDTTMHQILVASYNIIKFYFA